MPFNESEEVYLGASSLSQTEYDLLLLPRCKPVTWQPSSTDIVGWLNFALLLHYYGTSVWPHLFKWKDLVGATNSTICSSLSEVHPMMLLVQQDGSVSSRIVLPMSSAPLARFAWTLKARLRVRRQELHGVR